MRQVIDLKNIWLLNDLVEQVVVDIRSTGFLYTEEGDSISHERIPEERAKLMEVHIADGKYDVFNFVDNPELKKFSFREALEMESEDILNKYITEKHLQKVRGILRKDPRLCYGMVVSEEIEDEILNQFILIRWKENLKIWALQRQVTKQFTDCVGKSVSNITAKNLKEELVKKAEEDVRYANSIRPCLIYSAEEGVDSKNYYYWHHEVDTIRNLTYHELPSKKLKYRLLVNNNCEAFGSIEEVMEKIAIESGTVSIDEYAEDYSKQELDYLKVYLKNMKQDISYKKLEYLEYCTVTEELNGTVIENTEVGVLVLLEKQMDRLLLACGWDRYVTKFYLTENELQIIETNLNDVQLFYTEGILKNMKKSIWNKGRVQNYD